MNLTPQGVHKCSRPELLLDPFHPYSILVCLEWVLMGILHISMDENCEKLNFRPFFDKILAFDPLWCSEKELPPGVFELFLNFTTHISRIT